jgi:hypothetical protein
MLDNTAKYLCTIPFTPDDAFVIRTLPRAYCHQYHGRTLPRFNTTGHTYTAAPLETYAHLRIPTPGERDSMNDDL